MSLWTFLLFGLTSLFALHSTAVQFSLKSSNGFKPLFGFKPPILIEPQKQVEAPFLASFQVHAWHYCSGSIINARFVLTAAFCTTGLIAKSITVRVGSDSHRSGGSVVQVKNIFQPDEYDIPVHDYDFSLLELAIPLSFTKKIQYIALPDETDSIALNSLPCLVAGFGEPKDAKIYKDSYYTAAVPFVDKDTCQNAYISIHNITERMICAGSGNTVKLTCRGDEGSPLVCGNESGTNKLFGLYSWAESCGDPKYPGVYSRILAVRRWIREIGGI